MSAVPPLAFVQPLEPERRVLLHGIGWQAYIRMRETLDKEGSHARLTYLKGALEIMTTSRDHEHLKKLIARLLEAWALERDVELEGYGETTFQNEDLQRALEPDECFSIGPMKDVPHIAIEVVISSGLVNKLDVYAGLRVPEVWQYQDGRLTLLRLVGKTYRLQSKSRVLPSLDVAQLESFVRLDRTQSALVRAYVKALRAS